MATSPIRAGETKELEVATLLDKSNLHAYLVAIKSLFLFSGLSPAVTVLSDGTLDAHDLDALRRHVVGIRIVKEEQRPPITLEAEQLIKESPHLLKLFVLPLCCERPLVLFVDSDVVFKKNTETSLIDFPEEVGVVYAQDHDHSQYDKHFHLVLEHTASLGRTPVVNLNSGLMLWRRQELLQFDFLEFPRIVKRLLGRMHYVIEQDVFNVFAACVRSLPMPLDYLVLSNREADTPQRRKDGIAIHYVSGERYRRLDYLRDVRRVISLLNADKGKK